MTLAAILLGLALATLIVAVFMIAEALERLAAAAERIADREGLD